MMAFMKIKAIHEIPGAPPGMEGAEGVVKRVLIGREDGAPNFVMRAFDVRAGGHTPRHSHPGEHEVFVLSGRGTVSGAEGEHEIGPGSSVYVPPGEIHQFRADRGEDLRFLCIIPRPDRPARA